MKSGNRPLSAWLVLFTIAVLILSACSPAAPSAQPTIDVNAIYTAAAMTNQAQAPAPAPVLPSATSAPTAIPPTIAPPATCTDSAELVSEDPLDNAVFKPGDKITKRWTLKNTGTCTWMKYRFAFDGQAMGGNTTTTVDQIAPGQAIDLFAYPVAPLTAGTYKGGATLFNSSGGVVKVTYQGVAYNGVSVQIVVKGASSGGGITSVSGRIVLEQGSGAACTANATYFVYVDITSNGPTTAQYQINATDASGQVPDGVFDGFASPSVSNSMVFNAAEIKSVSLRLVGPYSYPAGITIRFRVNGGDWQQVSVVCP